MRDIGYTKEGNRLVEMSEAEYTQLSRLCTAVEGKEMTAFSNPNAYAFQTGFDFTQVFEVIRAFYLAHFRISDMEALIKQIKESINRG